MKNFILLFSVLCFYTVQSQQVSRDIVIGRVDTIHSKILGEDRKVWISVPPGYYNGEKVKYPVVYLLDGDGHFGSVTGMIRQLSEGFTNFVPKMIVVGILNTDRMRDLTPTHITRSADYGDSAMFKTTGGGKNFLSFIEKELMPYVDSAYPAAPYKMFIGHSLGGLIVVDVLLHHPQLFNSYVAIDPSLWYDERKLLKEASTIIHKAELTNKFLYVGIANTMKPGMDTGTVRRNADRSTSHIRSIIDFTNILKSAKTNGLQWDYRYYPNDDHGSVPLVTEYDALRFIFTSFRPPSWELLTDSSFEGDVAVVNHYKKISQEWGYKVLPPEPMVNSLGYSFLAKKNFSKSYTFFNMNVVNYPGSANVYDSMGDYWLAKGDKEKAATFFNKALAIFDSPATKEKLAKLTEAK